MILYDLCTADSDVRPSPFCWLVKFALLHKGLEFETTPVPFADKSKYPDPDYAKVPVLKDDGKFVRESADIVDYLEKTYPETPFLETGAEHAAFVFYRAWMGAALFPLFAPLLFIRIHNTLGPEDAAYFRENREKRMGKTLEDLAATPGLAERIEAALGVLAAPLDRHEFLGGKSANLSDYQIMSAFMWERTATSEKLYETPPPVAAWKNRMLDLFDGYARKAARAGA